MTRARALLLAAGWCVAPGVLQGQAATTLVRTGATFESYSFHTGLAFSKISEFTIPIVVTQRVGSRVVLDVGTAFVSASATLSNNLTVDHSGLVDTDIRATIGVVPGKLLLNIVGTIPTGAGAVPDTTIPLFGATATDLLGFTTPSFGSGGGMSAGFASAFKMGSNWAIGAGASYRYGASYTPVRGGQEMSPGGVGSGKYFRGALVFTTTATNDLTGDTTSTIGSRVLAYAAMSLPVGNSNLSVYGWDMRRLRPNPGTFPVPRGNVLALGARLERPLGPRTTLAPMLEFRHELTGPSQNMELLGYLVRTGTDLRYRLSDHATAVFQAQFAFGSLNSLGTSVPFIGPRLGTLIEWAR